MPTLWFRTLSCFFAIEHGRRRILHLNVTFHPTSDWIVQQLRDAFPLPCPYRYVLLDHDAKFGYHVLKFLKSSDLPRMIFSATARCRLPGGSLKAISVRGEPSCDMALTMLYIRGLTRRTCTGLFLESDVDIAQLSWLC